MSQFSKEEGLKFLKEKYKIALQIKDYGRAKKFLLKIKEIENEKIKEYNFGGLNYE